MHTFFRDKLGRFYKDSTCAVRVLAYLRNVYPYVLPTLDHVAFRSIGQEPPIDDRLRSFGFKDSMPLIFSSYADVESFNNVLQLRTSDNYIDWTLRWGDDINHIALDLSHYPDELHTIMNRMSNDLGIAMNDDGRVQVSSDGLQGSTQAELVGGSPKSFVEFIVRKIDPATKKRRDGFDGMNANAIFESTS